MNREQIKSLFIHKHNLHQAEIIQLPSDASFRSYSRLITPERNYILMDAPPEHEEVHQFMVVANFLLAKDLSAPEIIAADVENGFLLLEDLGEHVFSMVLAQRPENLDYLSEIFIYEQAIDVLIELQNQPIPDFLPIYSEEMLIKEAKLFVEWYLPNLIGSEVSSSLIKEFEVIWQKLLPMAMQLNPVVVLRDYHVDNLIWLEDRKGKKKVGIIDFQDAVIGSPIYDLVSLLEDARRDVPHNITQSSINYYLSKTPGLNRKDLLASFAILGAQRNCKIAGIFARKAMRDKNRSYLKFLPRVFNYINNDLKHPLLSPLKDWLYRASHAESQSNIALKGVIA